MPVKTQRFVSIDLDVVLIADVAPLWDRDEGFVAYRDPLHLRQFNGSMVLMRAGARLEVWSEFDPVYSPRAASQMDYRGSDQAWVSYRLPREATWSTGDCVYSYRRDIDATGRLPAGACGSSSSTARAIRGVSPPNACRGCASTGAGLVEDRNYVAASAFFCILTSRSASIFSAMSSAFSTSQSGRRRL